MKTKNIVWMALAALLVVTGLALIISFLRKPAASQANTTPTQDASIVLTGVALTAGAQMTEMAAITPSPLPATATLTPVPITATATSFPTALVTLPTPTSAGGLPSVDQVTFVADVTVPDGSNFSPGQTFVKTWRLKNTGATTWSTSYKLAYIQGDQMGGPSSVPVPHSVASGESVDISVSLIAPATGGHYRGFWKMTNASGQLFPESIYVDINVTGSGTATATPGTVTPTATPTTGTPGPTATSGTSGVTVSNVTLGVDTANFTGTCPHQFTFTGQFTLDKAATVTYQLEAQTAPPISLPLPVTAPQPAGTTTLVYPLTFNSSFSGWVRLHITEPSSVASDHVNITLTCQ